MLISDSSSSSEITFLTPTMPPSPTFSPNQRATRLSKRKMILRSVNHFAFVQILSSTYRARCLICSLYILSSPNPPFSVRDRTRSPISMPRFWPFLSASHSQNWPHKTCDGAGLHPSRKTTELQLNPLCTQRPRRSGQGRVFVAVTFPIGC